VLTARTRRQFEGGKKNGKAPAPSGRVIAPANGRCSVAARRKYREPRHFSQAKARRVSPTDDSFLMQW